MLFVPAHVDRYIESALKSNADCLILDLEDSVPEPEKEKARINIKNLFDKGLLSDRQIIVRANSLESGYFIDDVESTVNDNLLGYMPAKIGTADDVRKIVEILDVFEKTKKLKHTLKLLPLIETCEAIFNVLDIAKASDRLIALCFGNEDMATDLVGGTDVMLETLQVPRFLICAAARAVGIEPIDTVFIDMEDIASFKAREVFAKKMGYSGVLCVHPSQVSVANACFSPSDIEITKANKIIDAVETSRKAGHNITILDGNIVGPPMIKNAYKVLELVNMLEDN